MEYVNFSTLFGKKVVAFRGIKELQKATVLSFILFDGGETFLELREQDPYDYHDCSSEARILTTIKDAKQWKKMMDKDGYEEVEDFNF